MPIVGQWVIRVSYGTQYRTISLIHKVESVVAGAAITKCGRRMEPVDKEGNELETINFKPETGLCKRCE